MCSSLQAIGKKGLVWLTGAVVCLHAAPPVQLPASAGNGWLHNALRYHYLMPISCHFRDCKVLLIPEPDLCKMRYTIASTGPLSFIFTALSLNTP